MFDHIPGLADRMVRYAKENATCIRSSRHCAAIVWKKGEDVYGVNKYKTHPIMIKYGRNEDSIYLHAEMDAIVTMTRLGWGQYIRTSDLYVIRINKKGHLMPSCPCEGCMKAIKAFEFRKVYHS
jgi:deoxycytidylate deaminase